MNRMMMQAQIPASATITLKGSVDIVREFFEFSINSILYQRGIYPPETFKRVAKYGLSMMVTTDRGINDYLTNVMKQLEAWLETGEVERLVVVVTGADTGKTLERWDFAIQTAMDKENTKPVERGQKTQKEITSEIQAIIRQITASVTFLPLLTEACAFDLLVYKRNGGAEVPTTWEDSDPRHIDNAHEVKLRSFTTSIHNVDAAVTYRNSDDEDLPDVA